MASLNEVRIAWNARERARERQYMATANALEAATGRLRALVPEDYESASLKRYSVVDVYPTYILLSQSKYADTFTADPLFDGLQSNKYFIAHYTETEDGIDFEEPKSAVLQIVPESEITSLEKAVADKPEMFDVDLSYTNDDGNEGDLVSLSGHYVAIYPVEV